MKIIKLENYKINENLSVLSNASVKDLENLIISLEFASKYYDEELELYQMIDIIKKVKESNWEDLMEWRESLITDYTKTPEHKFTLDLIDRYCSNIEELD
jgi:hypothetical protein